MEKMNPSSENINQKHTIGRRKLLKLLASTTGAVGASLLLPEKWTNPILDVIVLPAHAQTSGEAPAQDQPSGRAFSLSGFLINPNNFGFVFRGVNISNFSGSFNFVDNYCEVDGNTTLHYSITGGGMLDFTSGSTLSSIPASIVGGSSCDGTITFPFTTNAYGETLSVNLNVNGRSSNTIDAIIPNQSP